MDLHILPQYTQIFFEIALHIIARKREIGTLAKTVTTVRAPL